MRLAWLPDRPDWAKAFADASAAPGVSWAELTALANVDLDHTRTNRLDRLLRQLCDAAAPPDRPSEPVRLAVLASSTVSHLLPAIRVGALRRGLAVETYEGPYGAYRQEIDNPASGLAAFRPHEILLCLDARHVTAAGYAADIIADLRALWRRVRDTFGCPPIQQTLLPVALPLMGSNEHRLAGSHAETIRAVNHALREAAEAEGVDLLALDQAAARDGLSAWHDPVWWLRAKQEVRSTAAPLFGDHVARILAARRGLSRKCLVLDLDNTLWGGVIGDDGMAGIVLGAGNAEGEAFLDVQAYAQGLARRGVILAVVSKNDAANALEAFDSHPEMLLRRGDIAALIANWDDKAQNLRRVAAMLNIGLDALVFLDDNPFERDLVRTELPMVAVPELPDDPALYAARLAEAGYFEALTTTEEDRARTRSYAADAERAAAANLPDYLATLGMRLVWQPFTPAGIVRIAQLVNKTNQFNLTTRRTTEAEVAAMMTDPAVVALQFRLIDRFGDNGIIGIVVAEPDGPETLAIGTWLMSCRVIGREVEGAMFDVLVEAARRAGARRLVGLYRPSAKNAMVRDHYARLGFAPDDAQDGEMRRYVFQLDSHAPRPRPIRIEGG